MDKLMREIMGENKSICDQVVEIIQNRMDADDFMTAAIQALEDKDYDEAMNLGQAVLDVSCNIEQRLAATFLFYLAVERNELAISAWLSIAYQYE